MTSNITSQKTAWYYESGGERHGPVSQEQIRAVAARGGLSGSTLVWRSGWPDWQPINATELRDLVTPAPHATDAGADDAGNTWHYEWGGQRLGPFTESQVQDLIAKGSLSRGTLVWRAGLDAWTPIESTELGEQLKRNTPPPLDGARVNNNVVWLLALSPVLISMLRYVVALMATGGNETRADRLMEQNAYWVLGPVISIALCYWDVSVLKKAGVNTQQLGQVWLVPVYLFKRAKALAQSPAYAWVWIGLFVLGLLAGA
jgi:hypothetical protein